MVGGEVGNMANYVLNEEHGVWGSTYGTKPGDRTFGVIGVWHSDPGNSVSMTTTPGTNPHAPAWGPFTGSGNAAWMGLRGHGDLTVTDPITHNPYNQDCLMFNGFDGSNTVTGNGTSKHFPGYGGRMDQIMYRDFLVDTTQSLTIQFDYRTAMSTDKDAGVKSSHRLVRGRSAPAGQLDLARQLHQRRSGNAGLLSGPVRFVPGLRGFRPKMAPTTRPRAERRPSTIRCTGGSTKCSTRTTGCG